MPGPLTPSLEWLKRMLGMTDEDTRLSPELLKQWPELEGIWAGRQIEMPEESARVKSIQPMSWLTKTLSPDAYARTGLLGGIELNKDLIQAEGHDPADVLVHELAHIGQGKQGFLRRYYEPNQVEDEAVNAEALRKVRKKDIYLRTPR